MKKELLFKFQLICWKNVELFPLLVCLTPNDIFIVIAVTLHDCLDRSLDKICKIDNIRMIQSNFGTN